MEDSLIDPTEIPQGNEYFDSLRVIWMKRARVEIPRMTLGARMRPRKTTVLRKKLTSQPPVLGGGKDLPEFSSVVLTSSKYVLPWTVTEEFIQDSPHGKDAEKIVLRLIKEQARVDLEEFSIRGYEDYTKGYIQLAGQRWTQFRQIRPAALDKALRTVMRGSPARPEDVVFYMHPQVCSELSAAGVVEVDPKTDSASYRSSQVITTTALKYHEILASCKDNLIFGIQRDATLRTSMEGKLAIVNDERYYALHLRAAFAIQRPEGAVFFEVITPREWVRRRVAAAKSWCATQLRKTKNKIRLRLKRR